MMANELAGGIWQGLICMALGLAIAIPCTIAFNYLVGRKNDIALDIEKSNAELLNILAFELASFNSNSNSKVKKSGERVKNKR